jgi:dihydrofolate synthase/folylpolyglutamate synthase
MPRAPADLALDFLASRIDYERALVMPYSQRDFRLERMRLLLARLGNPQDGLKIVHLAGTKGKGSTAAMIAAVLTAAGYRSGLYSSPHLDRVEERLAIDGAPCSRDELAELVAELQPVVASLDAADGGDPSNRPTYFEIVTALAWMHFARRRVQAAVIEVGMGGRLDSTNVCRPLVSVITTISFDHTQQLGNTLAAIAAEKAGIVKPGVPLVSGVITPEPRAVIAESARASGCRLAQLGRDFDFAYRPPRNLERAEAPAEMDFLPATGGPLEEMRGLKLSLIGAHQAANAAVGLAALGELRHRGFEIPERAVREGLARVRWPARIEVLSRRPAVVLDAAHNVASAEALVQALDESFAVRRRLLVFATTRDKNVRGMLEVLLPRFDELILTRYWSNPRGVPPEDLLRAASELSALGPRSAALHVCPDPAVAWRLAGERALADDLVCIAGSFFLAAEIRAAMA